MKSFKIIIAVFGILLICATSSFAQRNNFNPGSEPDGFRDIKWGTDLSSLSGMQYLRTEQSYGGVKIYLRDGDELTIGRANLNKIEYNFWKEKLCGVFIFTEGFTNFDGLKAAVFEKFGKGSQSNRFMERFAWFGAQTDMILKYSEISKKGELFMISKKINEQMEAEDKQRAKEGAKKGF